MTKHDGPSLPAPFVRPQRTRDRADPRTEYSELLNLIRGAGLLRRRRGFYIAVVAALTLALATVIVAMLLVGNSWWQLAVAAGLGVVLAQFGYVAHEAAHREVFESGRANDAVGRVIADLIAGISYSGWKTGHNRHHANPNLLGRDPSVRKGVFVYAPEDAASRASAAGRWYTRRQGWFFFPILLAAGLNLYVQGFSTVFGRERVDRRGIEIAFLLTRNVAYLVAVVALLPPGKAAAFVGVQLAAFGLATASSFVPNHVGMPVLPPGSRVDFLRRQVVTSRNIRGGWLVTAWMGGLNYQIEHHLFPSMPRPALARASVIVEAFCRSRGISYTQTGLFSAYARIVAHLNEVGKDGLRDPFRCPVAAGLGR